VADDDTFDGFGQVVPQVLAVGDLDGQRRARGCAFCVAPAAVAADDLHARVGIQPGAKGFRGPLGQHVHRPPGLDIDQDGAVDVPLAEREVINLLRYRSKWTYPDRGIIPTGGAAVWWMPWWRAGS
jgi:hypothetical protein